MNRYRKGYIFELAIKEKWEKDDWTCFRCAGSKPVDLIALKKQMLPRLIECKAGKAPSQPYLEKQKKYWEDLGFVYVLEVKKGAKESKPSGSSKDYGMEKEGK